MWCPPNSQVRWTTRYEGSVERGYIANMTVLVSKGGERPTPPTGEPSGFKDKVTWTFNYSSGPGLVMQSWQICRGT